MSFVNGRLGAAGALVALAACGGATGKVCRGGDCAQGGSSSVDRAVQTRPAGVGAIQTVFLILMENTNWQQISGDLDDAPFINQLLLPLAAHAQDYNGTGVHPSEPNYLWLEAGDNLGVGDDNDPSSNHQSTTQHLVTQLEAAGIDWTSWQEDIDGNTCPLTSQGNYAPKHNPMVFFDDVTDRNDVHSAHCIQHVRPYSEFAQRLQDGTLPPYNFITPNLCHDMHDSCAPLNNSELQGDTWLASEVPNIMVSPQYQSGGALFITWDESELQFPSCLLANCNIGMIAASPFAKPGYSNATDYDHSSTLKTVQEIFGVGPPLRAAGSATDLADLFTTFP